MAYGIPNGTGWPWWPDKESARCECDLCPHCGKPREPLFRVNEIRFPDPLPVPLKWSGSGE